MGRCLEERWAAHMACTAYIVVAEERHDLYCEDFEVS